MSKAKFGVMNGSVNLGLIWESENGDLMFVTEGNKIDINHDLQIRSVETGEDVFVDMRDVIFNAIKPKVKEEVIFE